MAAEAERLSLSQLENIYENRATSPGELETQAWEVICGALYEQHSEDIDHLPIARQLLERNGSSEDLRDDGETDYYLNARVTLATWGAIDDYVRGKIPDDETRQTSRSNLGKVILETIGPQLQLDDAPFAAIQKVAEALSLDLLLRNPASQATFGVPVHPSLHHFRGTDPETGFTAHQVLGVGQTQSVPMNVTRLNKYRPPHPHKSYKGVLGAPLGDLLMRSAMKFPDFAKQSRQFDKPREFQQWLIDVAANVLVGETTDTVSRYDVDEYQPWINATTADLAQAVNNYNPRIPSTRIIQWK